MDDTPPKRQPRPEGVRMRWHDAPETIRAAFAQWLGSTVASVASQRTGFSPGIAARLRIDDGRRYFVKAIGPAPNPTAPSQHRREANIVAALPSAVPAPRLLWSFEDTEVGWILLVFEDVEGRNPSQPWKPSELARVVEALVELGTALKPSPLHTDDVGTASTVFSKLSGWQRLVDARPSLLGRLDAWSRRNLEALAALEAEAPTAVEGDTLLHLDVRGDNLLLTPEKVWFVDWPLACVGATWLDIVLFAPSVRMQGGPSPDDLIARHPAITAADPEAVSKAIAALAGILTYSALKPAPPGMPTVRAFLAAQGAVAREWVAQRTGWT